MTYLLLRQLHITCVILSGIGFFLRGLWRLFMPTWSPQRGRWLWKVLPHCVDSVLLISAIALATLSGQYPFAQPWLTAKLFGLLVYIGCGMAAFRAVGGRTGQRCFFLLALVAYAYIVTTALTRDPLGWLRWWS